MKRILVLGGGFAGLWSAVGAMRELVELKIPPGDAEVVLVDQNPYHNIRVRTYESDLSAVIVPLDDVLSPIGVRRIEGRVAGIDCAAQSVAVNDASGETAITYDRLVLALGSQLFRPDIPELQAFGFDIDTYAAACRLEAHLQALAHEKRGARHGRGGRGRSDRHRACHRAAAQVDASFRTRQRSAASLLSITHRLSGRTWERRRGPLLKMHCDRLESPNG